MRRKRRRRRPAIRVCKGTTYQFVSISTGKRIYTDEDAAEGFPSNFIRDPNKMTFMELYVNGILQPKSLYTVSRGVLIFKSKDIPAKGSPIILQFVKITLRTRRKKRKRTPSAYWEEE